MNKVVSQRIVKWCAKSINITQDEEVVIGYGITMVLETVQKFMLLVLLGMLVGQWFEVAIILFTFGSIRNYAGGLHMKTKAGCTLLMVCVVVHVHVIVHVIFVQALGNPSQMLTEFVLLN